MVLMGKQPTQGNRHGDGRMGRFHGAAAARWRAKTTKCLSVIRIVFKMTMHDSYTKFHSATWISPGQWPLWCAASQFRRWRAVLHLSLAEAAQAQAHIFELEASHCLPVIFSLDWIEP